MKDFITEVCSIQQQGGVMQLIPKAISIEGNQFFFLKFVAHMVPIQGCGKLKLDTGRSTAVKQV